MGAAALASSNSVTRRTRGQDDAYFRDLHAKIKKERGQQNFSNLKDNGGDQKLRSKKRIPSVFVNLDDSERSSADEEDSNDDDDSDEEYKVIVSKNGRKSGEKGGRKGGRPPKKRGCVRGEADVLDDLVKSIWKEKDSVGQEEPVSVETMNARSVVSTLPLKFRFEDDEKPSIPEKSDAEKEVDCLFREMELALGESEIGCTDFSMTDDEDTSSEEIDQTSTTHGCTRVEHDPFHDEQIGIRCKCCSAVLLHIKHVLPPFYVKPLERHERKDSEESQNSTTNQFQFQDSASDNFESSVHLEGTVLDLIPDTENELYPHQREGFKFMWKNIAGDIHMKNLETLSANRGGGCIISHAPGTGKTRLTIVFLQAFMKVYPACRPMIIAPKGMLLTWEQEFQKWKVDIKFHNLNDDKLSSEEITTAASEVGLEHVNEKDKDCIRFLKLLSWTKGESILGISYQLFEKLAGERKQKGSNQKFRKILLELPGLIVMDEGHTPRNNQSLMWKAMQHVTTKRRIILSGTPFQNNFTELYNTLSLANPGFDKKMDKKSGQKRTCRVKGEFAHLTSSISKNNADDDGLNKLRSIMEPFVHVHQGGVLRNNLPGIKECLIILKPTDLQSKLLQSIGPSKEYLDQAYLASLISVHPSLITNPSLLAKNPNFTTYKKKLQKLQSDPNAGVKTRFLFELIKLSARLGEKVLIFSQFIDPLVHIKKLLKRHFSYNEGREVIYMDGELGLTKRQRFIESFNDKTCPAKVMLASQRACSEGINLVGASRVVLIDVVWNPSVKRQAISRAYRIGQEKIVYVYHLVTVMEVKKYAKQMEKERISELIFSKGVEKMGTNDSVLEDEVLEAMTVHESLSDVFEKIVHEPKDSDLDDAFGACGC